MSNKKKSILKNNEKEIRLKNYFLFFTIIVLVVNIYLLFRVNDLIAFIFLISSLLTELSIIFVLLISKRKLLDLLHNIYLLLLIAGSLFLKNIYLLFIIFILFIAFLTRNMFDVCLFYPEFKKTMNGTITIFVILAICIFRIYQEKMYKNILRF